MFLIDEVELAIKRSVLDKSLDNSQKSISFLSIANSALGPINVNFDAETGSEALKEAEYEKLYDFGERWSETYQASSFRDGLLLEKASELSYLLKKFGKKFSVNLVVGNGAYGFHPQFSSLKELVMKLSGNHERMKLGVEGKRYGKKAIDLASNTGSAAYILHTSAITELLDYARERDVASTVYALCRLSENGMAKAAADLVSVKGASYFERRGLSKEEISSRLGEFALFGTSRDVAGQIRNLIDSAGAKSVTLYPIFESSRDLISQMRMLSEVIS